MVSLFRRPTYRFSVMLLICAFLSLPLPAARAEGTLFSTRGTAETAKQQSWSQVPHGSQFSLTGFHTANDGGGGLFYVDQDDKQSADDGGTVLIARDNTRLKRVIDGPINVRWFGAVGDGRTDDTAAISAAWRYCTNAARVPMSTQGYFTAPTLHFPSGRYLFNGPSLTLVGGNKTFKLSGDGLNGSHIQIGSDDYLIRVSDISTLSIIGMQFNGGKGALKIANTGNNVRGVYLIRDCEFRDYTECAIGHLSADMPAWRIENNKFVGCDAWSSIGIALSGLSDNSVIRENQFHRNYYGIKLAGGFNTYIRNNDFIRFYAHDKDVADIWIVPVKSAANQALVIAENKFGNENLRATDFRILIAAEQAGAGDFVSSPHSATDASDRRVGLIKLRDNNFSGRAGNARGIITSYSSDLRYVNSDDMFTGSYPPQIVEFPLKFAATRLNGQSLSSAAQFYDLSEGLVPPLSREPIGLTSDPWSVLAGSDSTVQYFPTGEDPAYTPLLDPGHIHETLGGPARLTLAKDAYAGNDALDVQWLRPEDYAQASFSVAVAGMPAWIEFDLQSSPNSPDALVVEVRPSGNNGPIVFRRVIRPSLHWQRVRFLWMPDATGNHLVRFRSASQMLANSEGGKITLGRLHIYQAHEAVANGRMRAEALILRPTDPSSVTAGSLFIDERDGRLKIKTPDGITQTVETKP